MPPRHMPLPGSPFGPCFVACQHRECVELRTMAARECRHCGQPIGYDVAYLVDSLGAVHARCDRAIAELANPNRAPRTVSP